MQPRKPTPLLVKNTRTRTAETLRRNALKRLEQRVEGEFDPSSEPTVTPLLKAAEGGIPAILEALRAHSDADAREFISFYDSLSGEDKQYLTIEEIAHAAGIGSIRLAEVATSATILHGQMTAKLMIGSSMHRVAKSIVKAATEEVPILGLVGGESVVVGHTNGDTKAMELFGKISGMVPTPKGSTINFNNNLAQKDEPASQAEPAWIDPGDRLRMIHEAVEPRRLPSAPSEPLDLGGRLDHMQAETVEILSGDV